MPTDTDQPKAQGNPLLRTFVERYERLEGERDQIDLDLKEVMAEVKGNGFDPKAFRALLKRRKENKVQKSEHDALVDMYETALAGG